jgi:hypothetical protein
MQLHAARRSDLAPQQFARYAVDNLGCVAIMDRPSAIHVALRPRILSRPALVRALYFIGDADRAKRVVIVSHGDQQQVPELCGSPGLAISRLCALIPRASPSREGDFRRKRLKAASGVLRELVQRWHHNTLHPERSVDLLQGGVGGRFMIVTHLSSSRELLISGIGRGFLSYDSRFVSNAIGSRLEDQPDHDFARWAAEAFRDGSAMNLPIIDDVDALIQSPTGEKARLQYQRVILPCLQRNGDRLLICASQIDRSIDLRAECA